MFLLVNLLASFDDVDGDDEGAGDDGAASAAAVQQAAAAKTKDGDDGRKFNQDDVNRFVQERLAKDRKNRDTENQAHVASLEAKFEELLANKNLDSEEKDRLEVQLEDLRKQNRTKEQQAAHEKKANDEEWETKYETAVTKGNEWEHRYTESTITQALQSAAISHEAYNPQQIIVQLRSQTKLIDKMDASGKPTGQLVPMVEMTVKNADSGAAETLQMTPDEAVEYMKKSPDEWGNFFRNNIREGIGSSSATGGGLTGDGNVDHTKLNDKQWFDMRAKNPEALGLKARASNDG